MLGKPYQGLCQRTCGKPTPLLMRPREHMPRNTTSTLYVARPGPAQAHLPPSQPLAQQLDDERSTALQQLGTRSASEAPQQAAHDGQEMGRVLRNRGLQGRGSGPNKNMKLFDRLPPCVTAHYSDRNTCNNYCEAPKPAGFDSPLTMHNSPCHVAHSTLSGRPR